MQADMKLWPFNVVEKGGKPVIQVAVGEEPRKQYAPEEVSAMLLSYLKGTAEAYLGENVTEVRRLLLLISLRIYMRYYSNDRS